MGKGFLTSWDAEEFLNNVGGRIKSRIHVKAREIAGDGVITTEHIIQATLELGLEHFLHNADQPDPQESGLDKAMREYGGEKKVFSNE